MNPIEKLTYLFNRFPGIGPRQARRFVYYLLGQHPEYLADLSREINELKSHIKTCPQCFRYYTSAGNLCNICSDPNRDQNILIVVEKDVDVDSIEKSGIHDGYYFVLGGSLPILEKEPEKKIRINELRKRLEKSGNTINEIILAVSLTPEGENTADYISDSISPLAQNFNFKISHLGRGLSTGTEIEYSDKDTLKEAFKNRY